MHTHNDTSPGPVISAAGWLAAILLLVLYVYATVNAVGNWMGMSEIATQLSDGLSTAGIAWLSLGVAFPPAMLVLALIAGRGTPPSRKLLLLLVGLSLIAILTLNMLHFVPTTTYLQ